jgi:hypothetical protein
VPFLQYPTGSGWFWGVSASGLGGSTSATNGAPQGSLFGGKIGVDFGYTFKIGSGFAFLEQTIAAQSINGPGAGLSMSAALNLEQRACVGAPMQVVQQFAALIPGFGSASMPTLPSLPAGLSIGPANPYACGDLYEDDVSAAIGRASGKSWLLSYGASVGELYRISNGMVLDTSVEWKHGAAGMLIGQAAVGGVATVQPFSDTFLGTIRVKF